MTKEILIHQVVDVLNHAGFLVSDRCNIRPRCFDLAARQDDILLFCKVLYNIDGLNEETAREIKLLSSYLNGSPLIIGAKTRNQMLEDSVVYMRYDVPAMNVETLYDYLIEGIPPVVSAAPGGLYVSIDGDVLKQARNEISMSLGALASRLGVSRRTISKYEDGGMAASIEVVLQLEEILDVALARSIDFIKSFDDNPSSTDMDDENIQHPAPPKDSVLEILHSMGYNVLSTSQAPFKAVSKNDSNVMLTGVSEYSSAMIKRAHLMSNISTITETRSVFIINGQIKSESVESTVLIEKDELNKISGPEELVTLIENRTNYHTCE
ncbi:transcriptional regulator [Methanosalsum zhilinae]|nr:transcriptional regulator [Methanosalsum zhilinae]